MPSPSRLGIGRLAPLLLALLALADVATRLLPLDALAFRAWEAMVVDRAPTGPFGASRQVRYRWSYGDLVARANRSSLREYRDEVFTSDQWGFRNPPDLLAPGTPPLRTMLVGDSFAVGAGSSDQATLTAQLGQLLGEPVYNLGGVPVPKLADIRAAAQRLKLGRGGLVIYEFLTSKETPRPEPDGARSFLPPTVGPAGLSEHLETLLVSRLQIFAQRTTRLVSAAVSDEALEQGADGVRVDRLRGGRPMLFLESDRATLVRQRQAAHDYFMWLSIQLARDGLSLLVVLVPCKYEVYAPLLDTPAPPLAGATGDLLAADLERSGLSVVNLGPPLARAAAEALERGELIYWADDTHWNPAGMRVAAQAIAPRIADAR